MINTALIIELRRAQGMSQQKLAELAKLSLPTIYKIESGQQVCTTATLEAIAHALGVRAVDLFVAEQPGPQDKLVHFLLTRLKEQQ